MSETQATDSIHTESVTFPSGDGQLRGYFARPSGEARAPAVIVIHEIWGLAPHIEDVARRFAREGYAALAPDLYSRGGLPVEMSEIAAAMSFMQTLRPEARADPAAVQSRLSELPEADRASIARTMQWLQKRDLSQSVIDLQAALRWLSQQPTVNARRIGSLGFCMGGGLSARLAASGAPLAACVIFYGESPAVDQVANIRCPVLGLYGAEDRRITDGVPSFGEAMRAAGKAFEYHVYPGAPHAFFNDTRATYRPEAARDAWDRVLRFFDEGLRGQPAQGASNPDGG
jgi:carboxymethylenebutenolidase